MYPTNTLFSIIALSTCILVSVVEARLSHETIVGGVLAKKDEFPYQVSILFDEGLECGGGIIGDRHILTAAHCVLNDEGSFRGDMKVVAGATYAKETEKPAIRINFEKVYVLKAYDHKVVKKHGHHRVMADIAVVKLEKSLGIGPNSKLLKLRLPKSADRDGKRFISYEDHKAIVTGYGWHSILMRRFPLDNQLYEVSDDADYKLRYIEAKVVGNIECGLYFSQSPIHESNICARVISRIPDKAAGTCSADSGAPLVINNNTVIGVLDSSMKGCDQTDTPAIYARVSSYIPFILNAVKDIKTDDMRIGGWELQGNKLKFYEY